MKILLVYCHPVSPSFAGHLRDQVVGDLQARGHAVQLTDLYADGFSPVLTAPERIGYGPEAAPPKELAAYVDQLRTAEGLIFIYPTWWYGTPAMFKGYLDRVWLPNVAFGLDRAGNVTTGLLANIRRFAVITTYGAPWWLIHLALGDPGRNAVQRGLRRLFSPRCKAAWLAHYNMDKTSAEALGKFEHRVRRKLARMF